MKDGYLNSPRFRTADKVKLSVSHYLAESADMPIELPKRSSVRMSYELDEIHNTPQHPMSNRRKTIRQVGLRCALAILPIAPAH